MSDLTPMTKNDVVDDLSDDSADKPLSASKGKYLDKNKTNVILNGTDYGGQSVRMYAPTSRGLNGQVLVGNDTFTPNWEDKKIFKTIEVTWEHDISAHGGYREAGVTAPTIEGYGLFAVGGTGCNSWECIIVAKPVSTTTYDLNCVNVSDSDRHPFCWIRLVYAKNGWFEFS